MGFIVKDILPPPRIENDNVLHLARRIKKSHRLAAANFDSTVIVSQQLVGYVAYFKYAKYNRTSVNRIIKYDLQV